MKIRFDCPFCRLVINTNNPFRRVSAAGGQFDVAPGDEADPEEGSEAEDFGFRSTIRGRNAKRR